MKTTDRFLLILLGLFTWALPSPFQTEANTSFVLPSLGESRIAVILVTFQNDPDNIPFLDGDIPLTPKRCRSFLFDSTYSVAGFFAENSYGKFTLTGDVYGPYELPVDAPCAKDNSSCRVTQEVFAAADGDVDFSQYDIILTIYPRSRDAQGNFINFCGFQGSYGGPVVQQTEEGTFKFNLIWINGYLDLHIIAHEIGHLLGLGHASACQVTSDCNHYRCNSEDTNDPFDVMGYNSAIGYSGPGHFSAGAKYFLGWFEQKNIQTITKFEGRYRLSLSPLEVSSDSVQTILIPRNAQSSYVLEYRRPIGYDRQLLNIDGLLIKWITNDKPANGTNLLHPVCNSDQLYLPIGEKFIDNLSCFEIIPLKADDSSIELEIVFADINLVVWQDNFVWPDTVDFMQGMDIPFNIRNDSDYTVNCRVWLEFGTSPDHYSQRILNKEIENLSAGETRQVTAQWKPSLYNLSCGMPNYLSLAIELSGNPWETSLLDNRVPENGAAKVFLICNAPDLALELNSCLYPVNEFRLGETATIRLTIKNKGDTAAGPFSFTAHSVMFDKKNIYDQGLAAGDSIPVSLEYLMDYGPMVDTIDATLFYNDREITSANNGLSIGLWCRAKARDNKSSQLFPAIGNFQVVGDVLMAPGSLDKYGANLFLYNFKDDLLDMIPLKSGEEYKVLSSNDITLLFEIHERQKVNSADPLTSGTLYFCDLSSRELHRFRADTTLQFAPRLAGDWLTWFEEKDEQRMLYAQNLKTQQLYTIAPLHDTGTLPRITANGFVYWRDIIGKDDFLWCYNLHNQTGPYRIFTIQSEYFSFDVLDDAIVWTIFSFIEGKPRKVYYGQINHQQQTIEQIRPLRSPYGPSFSNGGFCDPRLFNSYVFMSGSEIYNLTTQRVELLNESPYDQIELHGGHFYYNRGPTGYFRRSINRVSLESLFDTVGDSAKQRTTIDNHHLAQNHPNPFNATTIIAYDLARPAQVELAVFNLAGQRIKTLVNGTQQQGSCRITWDGANEAGLAVAGGVYFYHFRADDGQSIFSETRKMVLLK